MSGLTVDFGGKVDFDDLHFTNSPNASPLIVWSSWDTNKIKVFNPQRSLRLFPFSSS
jgi:hypothetical protein